jgi:hypothetical protein
MNVILLFIDRCIRPQKGLCSYDVIFFKLNLVNLLQFGAQQINEQQFN